MNNCGEVGVNELNNPTTITLSPNPATTTLHLTTPLSTYNSCTITNTIGQQLLHNPITPTETNIPISNLHPGIYYLTLTGDKDLQVRRFIKE